MKIFSLRNILGVAAIYGVTQYAKKQGGFRPALDNVMDKLRNLGQGQHMGGEQIGHGPREGEELGTQVGGASDVSTSTSFGTGGLAGSAGEGAVGGEIGGNLGGGGITGGGTGGGYTPGTSGSGQPR